jgi:hypothetical protein
MNPSSIALLIVALLMATTNSGADRVDLLIDGSHGAATAQGAVIVVDGLLDIDAGTEVSGPVYVVGGHVGLEGAVIGDVVQLAGTVRVGSSGSIGGELRHIAGNLAIEAGAEIADRSEFEPGDESFGPGALISTTVAAVVLAGVGLLATRRRPAAVSNMEQAAFEHPLVALTVGTLVVLTFLAVFVFMAFTLVLLPVAILGIGAGVITATLGLIAVGRGVGRRLPIDDLSIATAVGGALVVLALQLVGLVPFLGDWIALSIILTGVGAVFVTYFGATRFETEALPGLAPAPTND